jgi:hypothetical protein
VVKALVEAARAGDDVLVRELLRALATCANVNTLYDLREALSCELDDPAVRPRPQFGPTVT